MARAANGLLECQGISAGYSVSTSKFFIHDMDNTRKSFPTQKSPPTVQEDYRKSLTDK
jgi:hypothetical protein